MRMKYKSRLASCAVASAVAITAFTPSLRADDPMLPHLIHQDGRHALIVDGAPFLMLGAQANNSSGWPAMLPKVWPAMEQMHVNTVEIPVYWEQFEPTQGHFDPSIIDTLLAQAREHKVRLVLLWFATWKNGSNHYMPAWMKLDAEKYPNATGVGGKFIDSPSAVVDATLAADKMAFSAFMAHLKQADPQHTVIMVQVENETGMWGGVRDHSAPAEKLFQSAVPTAALAAMGKTDVKPGANWTDAFGRDADEMFQVWCTARFVGEVAAAGKAIYPLPMYVNGSVRNVLDPGYPPKYQVGGPNDNVIALWQAAAPAIDILSPDIYVRDEAHYLALVDAFTKSNNPLLIPETGGQGASTRFFYAALAHGAIGFAPFGLDDTRAVRPTTGPADDRFGPTADNYAAIAPMAREIAALNFAGKVHAAVEADEPAARKPGPPVPDATIAIGDWQVQAFFGTFNRTDAATRPAGAEHTGRVLVADLGPGEFLITGQLTRLSFAPAGKLAGKNWQYLKVEEGEYVDGHFIARRILNGDQTDWGLVLGAKPTVLRVALYVR